ncbi:MAG: hypothetical protein V4547_17225 [Bacteroidota bacterium]
MDCPVPEHHWGTMQEYAEAYRSHFTPSATEGSCKTAGIEYVDGEIRHTPTINTKNYYDNGFAEGFKVAKEFFDSFATPSDSSGKVVHTPGKNKPFIVGNVREILDAITAEEISFSKGVELFNEVIYKWSAKQSPTPPVQHTGKMWREVPVSERLPERDDEAHSAPVIGISDKGLAREVQYNYATKLWEHDHMEYLNIVSWLEPLNTL